MRNKQWQETMDNLNCIVIVLFLSVFRNFLSDKKKICLHFFFHLFSPSSKNFHFPNAHLFLMMCRSKFLPFSLYFHTSITITMSPDKKIKKLNLLRDWLAKSNTFTFLLLVNNFFFLANISPPILERILKNFVTIEKLKWLRYASINNH